ALFFVLSLYRHKGPATKAREPSATGCTELSLRQVVSAFTRTLGQCTADQALEDAKRRAVAVEHRLDRHEDRLLQLILARHRGVAHLIGERHPCRPGWKIDRRLGHLRLVRGVGLHPIVEL